MPVNLPAVPSGVPIVASLPQSAKARRVWFVDIWGVMHNGVHPFATAIEACQTFRARGGRVILVSNAPRPNQAVASQLDRIGVARDAYDAILSSGDISRQLIAAYGGQTVLHVGPERDRPLFDGLGVTHSNDCGADASPAAIVCTGLADDDLETAADYAERLAPFAARGLPMICANPDLTVERGGRLIPCAGAVAAVYQNLGGQVLYAGKPYAPIYEAARQLASDLTGQPIDKSDILAIGDGIRTDIEGAARYGIDAVFIASAVSMADGALDDATLAVVFAHTEPKPLAALAALVW